MTTLELRIAQLVRSAAHLDDTVVIEPNDRLFDGGLGLDSIDALSLLVELEREFDCAIDEGEAHKVLVSVRSITKFVQSLPNQKVAHGG